MHKYTRVHTQTPAKNNPHPEGISVHNLCTESRHIVRMYVESSGIQCRLQYVACTFKHTNVRTHIGTRTDKNW